MPHCNFTLSHTLWLWKLAVWRTVNHAVIYFEEVSLKNFLTGILSGTNHTMTELKCSLSILITIPSTPLYFSLCFTIINWLEVFFFFKVDRSKEVFCKHKVNCVPLKIIINSSKASVTHCDKWTRWTESVMEGQMWKVSFSNHSAQRFASIFTNGHEMMKATV